MPKDHTTAVSIHRAGQCAVLCRQKIMATNTIGTRGRTQ